MKRNWVIFGGDITNKFPVNTYNEWWNLEDDPILEGSYYWNAPYRKQAKRIWSRFSRGRTIRRSNRRKYLVPTQLNDT